MKQLGIPIPTSDGKRTNDANLSRIANIINNDNDAPHWQLNRMMGS